MPTLDSASRISSASSAPDAAPVDVADAASVWAAVIGGLRSPAERALCEAIRPVDLDASRQRLLVAVADPSDPVAPFVRARAGTITEIVRRVSGRPLTAEFADGPGSSGDGGARTAPTPEDIAADPLVRKTASILNATIIGVEGRDAKETD